MEMTAAVVADQSFAHGTKGKSKPRPFQKAGRIGHAEEPNQFLGVSRKSAKGLPRVYLIKSSSFSAMSGADWSQ